MKVLLLNGSPHENGCTHTALQEIANTLKEKQIEYAYIALHGKYGEDGCIQGMLELAQIPYTGPGVAASAVCMNKVLTKQVLAAYGIPTAKFIVKRYEECINILSLK